MLYVAPLFDLFLLIIYGTARVRKEETSPKGATFAVLLNPLGEFNLNIRVRGISAELLQSNS